jgi:CBS domain-containing protein
VARVPVESRGAAHVREVARRAPAVPIEQTASRAGAIMRALRLPALPIVERGELVAVLGEADLRAAEELARLAPDDAPPRK